jgi:gamma-glutamyl hydrolase
VAEGKKE